MDLLERIRIRFILVQWNMMATLRHPGGFRRHPRQARAETSNFGSMISTTKILRYDIFSRLVDKGISGIETTPPFWCLMKVFVSRVTIRANTCFFRLAMSLPLEPSLPLSLHNYYLWSAGHLPRRNCNTNSWLEIFHWAGRPVQEFWSQGGTHTLRHNLGIHGRYRERG